MPQFAVYQNKNIATRKTIPLLLDIQSDLLRDLKTTVVIPLYNADSHRDKSLTRLMPALTIEDKEYLAFTTQLAGISRKELGKQVALVSDCRHKIISAIDFLIAGS